MVGEDDAVAVGDGHRRLRRQIKAVELPAQPVKAEGHGHHPGHPPGRVPERLRQMQGGLTRDAPDRIGPDDNSAGPEGKPEVTAGRRR